jgi:calcium-dependent protein kinase
MHVAMDLFIQLKKGTISDFYETGEVLGEGFKIFLLITQIGAFGKVWKVTHRTTSIVRAMKSIKKNGLIKED